MRSRWNGCPSSCRESGIPSTVRISARRSSEKGCSLPGEARSFFTRSARGLVRSQICWPLAAKEPGCRQHGKMVPGLCFPPPSRRVLRLKPICTSAVPDVGIEDEIGEHLGRSDALAPEFVPGGVSPEARRCLHLQGQACINSRHFDSTPQWGHITNGSKDATSGFTGKLAQSLGRLGETQKLLSQGGSSDGQDIWPALMSPGSSSCRGRWHDYIGDLVGQ